MFLVLEQNQVYLVLGLFFCVQHFSGSCYVPYERYVYLNVETSGSTDLRSAVWLINSWVLVDLTASGSVPPGTTFKSSCGSSCSASCCHVTSVLCRHWSTWDRSMDHILKWLQRPSFAFFLLYFVGWLNAWWCVWVRHIVCVFITCAHAPDATCRCFIYVFYIKIKWYLTSDIFFLPSYCPFRSKRFETLHTGSIGSYWPDVWATLSGGPEPVHWLKSWM